MTEGKTGVLDRLAMTPVQDITIAPGTTSITLLTDDFFAMLASTADRTGGRPVVYVRIDTFSAETVHSIIGVVATMYHVAGDTVFQATRVLEQRDVSDVYQLLLVQLEAEFSGEDSDLT